MTTSYLILQHWNSLIVTCDVGVREWYAGAGCGVRVSTPAERLRYWTDYIIWHNLKQTQGSVRVACGACGCYKRACVRVCACTQYHRTVRSGGHGRRLCDRALLRVSGRRCTIYYLPRDILHSKMITALKLLFCIHVNILSNIVTTSV